MRTRTTNAGNRGQRMLRFRTLLIAAMFACPAIAGTAHAVDVTPFVAQDAFGTIEISPDGSHYAATVPLGDRTALAILRRADNKLTGSLNLGRNRHVADFWWVSNDRLMFSSAQKIGMLDEPLETGDLYTATLDGRAELLAGQSLQVASIGSNIRAKKAEQAFVFMADPHARDGSNVVVSVVPFGDDPFTRADRMDIVSGRRSTIARAPVRNARFTTDNAGEVRAAVGFGVDNASKLFVRKGKGDDWVLVNDETVSGIVETPVGFSADNATMILVSQRKEGTDVLVGYDMAAGTRRELLADAASDPGMVIHDASGVPVGAWYAGARPRTAFIDAASPTARQYRSLEAAFPGQSPIVTSSTRDGSKLLVQTVSDRNPGDFYLFDTVAKKADFIISRREQIDPERMAATEPFSLKARDGQSIHGFLTRPAGATKATPMVVLVHGGPFNEQDTWLFDPDTQVLASAGYSVLRVNFRGSGGYGRAYTEAGARQWGARMQDDVTDATRWAVAQGHADGGRVCIMGGSYGAYAALMGVVREPGLYRCAIGYVGVYDLPMLLSDAKRTGRRLGNHRSDWVGDDDAALAAVSPNRLASRVKAPVFLAAGGEDEIAPIEHSRRMEKALLAAGVPVETYYVPTEGHGFYVDANRKTYQEKVLGFLGRHIGAGTAAAPAAASP